MNLCDDETGIIVKSELCNGETDIMLNSELYDEGIDIMLNWANAWLWDCQTMKATSVCVSNKY